jgi:RNA polymerase sigma-70 factor (subfamily 1)
MSTVPAARIRAAVDGDVNALNALLEEYGPTVRRTLHINPRYRAVLEATDVMQVTYMEAFLQIGRLELHTPEAFVSWLTHLAQNNLHDATKLLDCQKRPDPRRRLSKAPGTNSQSTILGGLPDPDSQTPSVRVAGLEAQRALEEALANLPEPYAQAVRLHDLEGMTLPEVAAAMKRSRGAVCMLRARGLERLRVLLGPQSHFFSTA